MPLEQRTADQHAVRIISSRRYVAKDIFVPGNRAVIYKGPGDVAVETIDYPSLELKDGPGVNPANVGRQIPARGDPQGGRHQHLRQRPAHGPRPDDGAVRTRSRP